MRPMAGDTFYGVNTYLGETLLGMSISMCLDEAGKIISAYPVYEGLEEVIFRLE
jgi:hypothetical protein